jgi:thymidylate synthase (FAD)
MDFNKVKIISVSSFLDRDMTIEEQIAYIARVSNPENQELNKSTDKLCNYLIKNHHWSPFEMVNITIEIQTTRDISRQMVRHRSFSFQEFSQRYANPKVDLGFTLREARLQHPKNRQMSVDTDNTNLKNKFIQIQEEMIKIQSEYYDFCIKNGIAKEQSRVLLSEGLTLTKLYMNGSLRSWIHYLKIRTDPLTTQKEHTDVALKIKEQLSLLFPLINSI